MRQRIACGLIIGALSLIAALIALLLSDAMAPGRVPPLLAFWGACGAGVLLMGGLVLLEQRSTDAPRSIYPLPHRG